MGVAISNFAKTFAEEWANDHTDEFKAALDSRYEEYINGEVLVSEAEVDKRITNIIRNR